MAAKKASRGKRATTGGAPTRKSAVRAAPSGDPPARPATKAAVQDAPTHGSREEVHPLLAKMLDLRWFHDHGWERKVCRTCNDAFWTVDAKRTLCGDSTCEEYSFLGDPLTDDPMSLAQMREAFLSFWEGKWRKGEAAAGFPRHTRVPRHPVVARWRDDIYLNIASIANYQPHVTSGEVAPPANPLVVSQPCIRLNDLANIGRSGRHFSCFEMMGHHAFNSKEWGEHYWTEECVARGHEFLTDVLGLDGARITYKESTWSGGGNAGPCVEVFAGGLEVATLVFMCLEECEPGDVPKGEEAYVIKGVTYRRMDLRIIDTGWGLERLAWASTGTPTAYDTVFPETIAAIRGAASVPIADDKRSRELVAMHARVQGILNLDIGTKLDGLRQAVVERMAKHGVKTTADELANVMDPIESMYALADHLRCLSFMVGDGVVPGNVKAGYLMRLVFRRAFRFAERLGIEVPLADLLADNMQRMLAEFPGFEAAIPRAREIALLEHERFLESRDRGVRLVERVVQKKRSLGVEELVEFYDTHGIGPHTVAEAAAKLGVEVEVPDTFDALVAERHERDKKVKAKRLVPAEVPATRMLFYETQDQREFDAKVVWAGDVEGAPAVVLDRTCFFWETGGQPADRGTLAVVGAGGKGTKRDGTEVRVLDVKKDGERAVHLLDSHLRNGVNVHGLVDWQLRMDHTRSHTATHIMNQAVRRVLGSHSWQAGTQKHHDCARVDMTHYRRPTRDELSAIEKLANWVVLCGAPVTRSFHDRNEAETLHGLGLLQGGIPKGRRVRVVHIGAVPRPFDWPTFEGLDWQETFDVEYCGGTHCHTTQDVGPIKLWRTERVQDGIERFEYSAGLHAVERWQADDAILRDAAAQLDVAPAELPQAARRFFLEWKERGKLLAEVQHQLATLKAQTAGDGAEAIAGVRLVVQDDLAPGALQETAARLVAKPKTVALLAAPDGDRVRLLFGRSADVEVDMNTVLREAAVHVGGKGGGRPDFAQGAGQDVGGVEKCLQAARDAVRRALR